MIDLDLAIESCRTRMTTRAACALIVSLFSGLAFGVPAFTDGDFGAAPNGDLGGWSVTSGTVTLRPVSDSINGYTFQLFEANKTFDLAGADYFTTGPFAVLGDTLGMIGDAPDATVNELTRSFELPPGGPFAVDISFRAAMDGFSPFPEDNYGDSFIVKLVGPNGFDRLLHNEFFGVGSGQISLANFSTSLSGLEPGRYTLVFRHIEDFDTLNTAVGLDNVSVEYSGPLVTPTNVPLPLWATFALVIALTAIGLAVPTARPDR